MRKKNYCHSCSFLLERERATVSYETKGQDVQVDARRWGGHVRVGEVQQSRRIARRGRRRSPDGGSDRTSG
jgi:hypothetical protein